MVGNAPRFDLYAVLKTFDAGDGTMAWKWGRQVVEKHQERLAIIAETRAGLQPMAAVNTDGMDEL